MTINSLLGHIGGRSDITDDAYSSHQFKDDPLSDTDAKRNQFDAFNSVAVLDLGGGSAQVTFTPIIDEYMIPSASGADFVIKKRIGNEIVKLYTHSYLGYGLMSARKAILRMAIDESGIADDNNVENIPENNSSELPPATNHVHVNHPCFKSVINPLNHDDEVIWTFEGVTYHINSSSDGDCSSYASKYILGSSASERAIDNPRELNVRDIYAISYYYDRAVDAGLIDPLVRHQVIKVKKFVSAAKKACKRLSDTINIELLNSRYLRKRVRNSAKLVFDTLDTIASDGARDGDKNPFLCLDLSYIAAFLKDGLELNMNKDIHVANQVNGVEASWSLGAAYDLFYSMSDNSQPLAQDEEVDRIVDSGQSYSNST